MQIVKLLYIKKINEYPQFEKSEIVGALCAIKYKTTRTKHEIYEWNYVAILSWYTNIK